jgi:hypothetical protein
VLAPAHKERRAAPEFLDARIHHRTKDFSINNSLTVGKYLITPLTRRQADAHYAASVSIRSGTGAGTHDRVLRLASVFEHRHDALRYAVDQGVAWVGERQSPQEPAWPRKN